MYDMINIHEKKESVILLNNIICVVIFKLLVYCIFY